MLIAVAAVGLNLRPFLTAIGPLAADIRAATGFGYQAMASLTLLPMVLMGLGAFVVPVMRARLGARRALLGALALLGAGSALRLAVPDGAALIATAALCGLGVAVVQSAYPGIVKAAFPTRVASVMGLYSASLMGGGALGARLTPAFAALAGDWRAGLALWALPAWAALWLAWRTLPREPRLPSSDTVHTCPASALTTRTLLRRPRTWLLMGSFGLMNAGYASLVAWLAPFYQTHGFSAAHSGGLVAWMSVAQAAAALLMPTLAGHRRDRRAWLALALALQAAGFAGLALAPALSPVAWVVIGGAGLGGAFALFLVTALDHLSDPASAGTLGALMQGGGFLLAAMGPWITAWLHDAGGGFAAGWWLHLGCVVAVLALITRLDPARYAQALGTQKRVRPD